MKSLVWLEILFLQSDDLTEYGSAYYNCSRKAVKEQLMEEAKGITNFTIDLSWKLYQYENFNKAQNADYLVIDEAHHMFSDSYCDATNYVFDLLLNKKPKQTIILLSACVDYLTCAFACFIDNLKYISRIAKKENIRAVTSADYTQLQKWIYESACMDSKNYKDAEEQLPLFNHPLSVIDVMYSCHNFYPQNVHIINIAKVSKFLNDNEGKQKACYKKCS